MEWSGFIHRLSEISFIIAMVLIWIIAIMIGIILLYPFKPITINDFYPETTEVMAGREICGVVNYDKYVNAPSTIIFQLVNGHTKPIGIFQSHLPAGKHIYSLCTDIPANMVPGYYYLLASFNVKVLGIREIPVTYQSKLLIKVNPGERKCRNVGGL